jgi:TonB family protein
MLSPSFVLAYSAQVAVLAAVAGLVLAMSARRLPQVRLAAWRGVLAASWLLPAAALWPSGSPEAAQAPTTSWLGAVAVLDDRPATAAAVTAIDWTFWLTVALASGALVRVAWLGAGIVRLRRATRGLPHATCPLFQELCRRHGVDALLIWHPTAAQPFTFGCLPALVVVPASLASESTETRRAVYTHELVHAARRDWRWMLADEIAAAPLWFHPAIWAARRELQQAREEIVDRATVVETGARRRYAKLLVALAERPAGRPLLSLPFFSPRQLSRRIAALLSEPAMSTSRLVASSSLVVVACAFSLAVTAQALPLPSLGWHGEHMASPQGPSQDPGPLERAAYVAPRDMAPPPRVTFVAPAIPSWVGDVGEVGVTLRLVLDAEGRVAEVRAIDLSAHVDVRRSEAVVGALIAAVRQWRFARPAAAPVAVTVPVMVVATSMDGATQYSLQERPIATALKPAAYPEADEKARTEGTAQVEVTVDATGRVTATRLVKATTPAMGESAIAALKESTFHPGMKDGSPVPVVVTIAIRFALR